ncbi:MFS transporter [Maritalea sp. S77]|uniref:MFS transporter n=1 Tax=Maritalea sp. S77 TaxID=3415125 RepID=UPI003C7C2286
MVRNINLFPWFKFAQSLIFWQATWFLYFERNLSAAEAIFLYVIYDIATTVLEVPSGYMSDRLGRRLTLIAAALSGLAAILILVFGEGFSQFMLANVLLGASAAFASGTDSSLLYESLSAEGRAAEIEQAELKAWRFGFTALALSAVMGGALALFDDAFPWIATALAGVVLLGITLFFREPPHGKSVSYRESFNALRRSFVHPTLIWLLGLTLLMYVFSHLPFVFGQPFIRESLAAMGYAEQTPLVSGAVTGLMMVISVGFSHLAMPLRNRFGLGGILLLAFGLQIGLTVALATSNNWFVIALLFFRMVPDSLSRPFIQARIQPLLQDGTRATYLSVQSLAGRLLFAITLSIAAGQTSGDAAMPYSDMQLILAVYAGIGLLFWLVLVRTAKRAKI